MTRTQDLIDTYIALRTARNAASNLTDQFAAEDAAAEISDQLFALDDAGDELAAEFITRRMLSVG